MSQKLLLCEVKSMINASLKLCFVLCLHDGNGDDHGVRRADTAQEHARWCYLAASHEATNSFHRLMCLAPYLPSGMVVASLLNIFHCMCVDLVSGGRGPFAERSDYRVPQLVLPPPETLDY